jgi:ribose 5-phosphate isomerase A
MTEKIDPVLLMKQEVGKAAANRVQSNSIVGLGTGSTTAFALEYIGDRLKKRGIDQCGRCSDFFSGRGIGP